MLWFLFLLTFLISSCFLWFIIVFNVFEGFPMAANVDIISLFMGERDTLPPIVAFC